MTHLPWILTTVPSNVLLLLKISKLITFLTSAFTDHVYKKIQHPFGSESFPIPSNSRFILNLWSGFLLRYQFYLGAFPFMAQPQIEYSNRIQNNFQKVTILQNFAYVMSYWNIACGTSMYCSIHRANLVSKSGQFCTEQIFLASIQGVNVSMPVGLVGFWTGWDVKGSWIV